MLLLRGQVVSPIGAECSCARFSPEQGNDVGKQHPELHRHISVVYEAHNGPHLQQHKRTTLLHVNSPPSVVKRSKTPGQQRQARPAASAHAGLSTGADTHPVCRHTLPHCR